jgi:cation diffusion facilitator CzcD-associated flavoprotein CzcO
MAKAATALATRNIHGAIADPELRARVTPHFRIGCKRVLISNDYYPALARDNADVVTDRIVRITPTGVVTADGTERPVDGLIVATGLHTTEQPIAEHVKGREGRTLADAWREGGMAAYKGTTIHGFPNLFQIVGPNTGLGHSSMVFIIESQVRYIVSALQEMGARGLGAVEPTAEAQRRWNDDLHRRMARTVWSTGGCASWYLDEHGRNTTLWPRATFRFRQLLSRFDVEEYDVTPRTAQTKEHAA